MTTFAKFHSHWPRLQALADAIDEWASEYTHEYDRQNGQEEGYTPPPNKPIVRQAPRLTASDQIPAIVIWPAGSSEHVYDPEGQVLGDLEVGIRIYAGANSEESTGELLHDYVAIVKQLLIDRGGRGWAAGFWLMDEDFTAVDETRGEVMVGATLSFVATTVEIGTWGGGPGPGEIPREDPTEPWPATPTVASTNLHPLTSQSVADPED